MEMETYSKNAWNSNTSRLDTFTGVSTRAYHANDEEILDIDKQETEHCRPTERALLKHDSLALTSDVIVKPYSDDSGQNRQGSETSSTVDCKTDKDGEPERLGSPHTKLREQRADVNKRIIEEDDGDNDESDYDDEALVVNIEDGALEVQENDIPPLADPCLTNSGSSMPPRLRSPPITAARMTASIESSMEVSPPSPRPVPKPAPEQHSPQRSQSSIVKSVSSRSLPIHCIIEEQDDMVTAHSHLLMDSYAILPGATPFSDIVPASLSKLGYSAHEATGAKGCLQLKNWKTLTFSAITDNPEATVEEILGEITSVTTLKITLVKSSTLSQNCTHPYSDKVKEKLLQLMLTKSKDFLVQSGCPIDKSLLDSILSGEATSQTLSDHMCSSFNEWYICQKEPNSASVMPTHSKMSNQPSLLVIPAASAVSPLKISAKPANRDNDGPKSAPLASPLKLSSSLTVSLSPVPQNLKAPEEVTIKKEMLTDFQKEGLNLSPQQQPHFLGQGDSPSAYGHKSLQDKAIEKSSPRGELFKMSRSPNDGRHPSTIHHHASNPYLGLMPGKTRIRTSFDPEHEIPRLQKWFNDNQHPTREQMMRFMQELNGLESRKGRRPLDLTNIIYWFKNARAAQRRATKALDDSFENEENVDLASGNSDCIPPYLPNKNAVYMIPFHPYPHLMTDSGSETMTTGDSIDEPYDLSVTKRPSDLSRMPNGKDKLDKLNVSTSSSPSPNKSSSVSSEGEIHVDEDKKGNPFTTPRFPALLDVASKLRQEIPDRSKSEYHSNAVGGQRSSSPCRTDIYDKERSSKLGQLDNGFSSPAASLLNGTSVSDNFLLSLKRKQETEEYMAAEDKERYHRINQSSRESHLELGQVSKEQESVSYSDEENTNDSYNSEEDLKLRMKRNAAVLDYASALHNNVSRLTAANMAALSLAQMGHIPQLPPSLAMAYYPMDPRFYTQTSVQHSLSTSPPNSLTSNHSSHLAQLSIRQDSANRSLDASSPLPSPSALQQPINHHHPQHHAQRLSPQDHHHHRHHSSEPRKRRTRVFIDPLTEIPKLEKWFLEDTHPSAFMIDKYCEELNKCEYRHKFPKLEPKNVQLWFKNHRAKVKRMKVSYDGHGDLDCKTELDDDMDEKLFC